MGVFDDVVVVDVEAKYNRFITFFMTILKSLNPGSYKDFIHRKARFATLYLCNLIIFAMILFFIVLIPFLLKMPAFLNTELVKIDNLEISPSVEITNDITLKHPHIAVAENKTYDGEFLLITETEVSRKNTMCLLSKIWCYFDNEPITYTAEGAREFLDNEKKLGTSIFAIVLLMLPGILIALFFYYLIKYVIIIVAFSVLMHALSVALKFNLNWKKVLIIGIHSATIMVLLDVVLGFFLPLAIIPLLLYILFFALTIWFVGESRIGKKW